jgi:hypothetical protein
MRNVSRLLLLVVVLALASYTFAAQTAPTAPQAPQQDKAFQGTLTKVDSDAKIISVMGADNKEMMFHYTDQTEIVGSEKTVQGLAAKSGAKLSITYKAERGTNNATRIELLP